MGCTPAPLPHRDAPPQEPICEVCGWNLSDDGNEYLPDGRLACALCARLYHQRRDVQRAAILNQLWESRNPAPSPHP